MKDNLSFLKVEKNEKGYPKELTTLKGMPQIIYYRGRIENTFKKIAIVGTRKATEQGKNTAFEFSRLLSKEGFIIVSGLANGIDTSAHKGALEVDGTTWAVMGSPINKIYPTINEKLAIQILENNGCILSELSPNSPTYPNSFVLRNRIISGLSDAIIVIEAPEKSGALATALFGQKQGKKIFVIPGPINSINYKGSHKLIREGARLVTSVKEILEDLGYNSQKENNTDQNYRRKNEKERVLIEVLKSLGKPASVDKICQMTTLNAQEVMPMLTNLIIDQTIVEEGQGRYNLKN